MRVRENYYRASNAWRVKSVAIAFPARECEILGSAGCQPAVAGSLPATSINETRR